MTVTAIFSIIKSIVKSKWFIYVLAFVLASLLFLCNQSKYIIKKELKITSKALKITSDSISRIHSAHKKLDTTITNYVDSITLIPILIPRDSTVLNLKDSTIYNTVTLEHGGWISARPLLNNELKLIWNIPTLLITKTLTIWERPHLYLTGGIGYIDKSIYYNDKRLPNVKFSLGLQYINKKYGFGLEYERIGTINIYGGKFIYRIF